MGHAFKQVVSVDTPTTQPRTKVHLMTESEQYDARLNRLAMELTPEQMQALEVTNPAVAGLVKLRKMELDGTPLEEIRAEIKLQASAKQRSTATTLYSDEKKSSLASRMAARRSDLLAAQRVPSRDVKILSKDPVDMSSPFSQELDPSVECHSKLDGGSPT